MEKLKNGYTFLSSKINYFMKKNLPYWRILPYQCLEKAYKAGKRIHKIKKNYGLYQTMLFSSKYSWQSIFFHTTTELNDCIFTIYLSLFSYKICLSLINVFHSCKSIILNTFKILFHQNKSSNNEFTKEKKFRTGMGLTNNLEKLWIKKMNRRLAWIEATLNDLYIWKREYLFTSSRYIDSKKENYNPSFELKKSEMKIVSYESIGLLPRSITRTLSRFKAELTNQSNSLVLQEFRLAKYQALASLQYIGCLIIIPLSISIFSQKCFSEPLINYWWNNQKSQIFLTSFQEEKALKKLQQIEELFWLDKIVANSFFPLQSQNLAGELHQQTIELVKNYNDESIETISHFSTDIIYFMTLGGGFILGKERLVILNSWVQELFYSLSDTMKAFFILLLTDLCIGFHSPHGWELIISSYLEHFGFVHNKQVISCSVSTFPVILDTVFKYLIFRHLNRISPSIVATYHTMNE